MPRQIAWRGTSYLARRIDLCMLAPVCVARNVPFVHELWLLAQTTGTVPLPLVRSMDMDHPPDDDFRTDYAGLSTDHPQPDSATNPIRLQAPPTGARARGSAA